MSNLDVAIGKNLLLSAILSAAPRIKAAMAAFEENHAVSVEQVDGATVTLSPRQEDEDDDDSSSFEITVELAKGVSVSVIPMIDEDEDEVEFEQSLLLDGLELTSMERIWDLADEEDEITLGSLLDSLDIELPAFLSVFAECPIDYAYDVDQLTAYAIETSDVEVPLRQVA